MLLACRQNVVTYETASALDSSHEERERAFDGHPRRLAVVQSLPTEAGHWCVDASSDHSDGLLEVSSNDGQAGVLVPARDLVVLLLVDFHNDGEGAKVQSQVGPFHGAPALHGAVPDGPVAVLGHIGAPTLKRSQDKVFLPYPTLGQVWVESHEAAPTKR